MRVAIATVYPGRVKKLSIKRSDAGVEKCIERRGSRFRQQLDSVRLQESNDVALTLAADCRGM